MTVIVPANFNPAPSHGNQPKVRVFTSAPKTAKGEATAVFVSSTAALPARAGVTRDELIALGFEGKESTTLPLPHNGSLRVFVGTGDSELTAAGVRDVVAAFTRTSSRYSTLNVDLRGLSHAPADDVIAAAIEGAVLARYRYEPLKSKAKNVALATLNITVSKTAAKNAKRAIASGLELARAASLARDLANTPPRHLNAERFANLIAKLAPEFGLKAEIYDRAKLIKLGCGGLLGVNAGSTDEPRMVVLTYKPRGASGHLAFVGKGIMYDSGGISLKPSGAMHATMKLDMSGAAAVFSAMTALKGLGVKTAVTGWLMCTDNMPSGSATKLGDVLTIRGGTTVEVKNTDAEGRLVLADGLTLATETKPDAIVDIATLTGAALAALGPLNAAVFANNDDLLAQVKQAARVTDESIWNLPLDHRYRETINSEIADLQNIGGEYGGAITAALFLNEFVAGTPWSHLDIAATMRSDKDALWKSTGATGFGTRLLAQLALNFAAPKRS